MKSTFLIASNYHSKLLDAGNFVVDKKEVNQNTIASICIEVEKVAAVTTKGGDSDTADDT